VRKRRSGRLARQNHWWVILGGVLATAFATVLAILLPMATGELNLPASIQLVMFMLAAIALSSVVGFIFGVPRTRIDQTDSDDKMTKASWSSRSQPGRFEANSNLEQISDWLTKVLVPSSPGWL
jgi:high-affinity Fe2+/Pb2+ permease